MRLRCVLTAASEERTVVLCWEHRGPSSLTGCSAPLGSAVGCLSPIVPMLLVVEDCPIFTHVHDSGTRSHTTYLEACKVLLQTPTPTRSPTQSLRRSIKKASFPKTTNADWLLQEELRQEPEHPLQGTSCAMTPQLHATQRWPAPSWPIAPTHLVWVRGKLSTHRPF